MMKQMLKTYKNANGKQKRMNIDHVLPFCGEVLAASGEGCL